MGLGVVLLPFVVGLGYAEYLAVGRALGGVTLLAAGPAAELAAAVLLVVVPLALLAPAAYYLRMRVRRYRIASTSPSSYARTRRGYSTTRTPCR
jgi:hypothetical protein